MVESPEFTGDRVLGAILFEGTMDREIGGMGSAEFLWNKKHVIPFLKIDKGLADEAHGVQIMKPNPDLDALLARALKKGVFGTKMRSVIKLANSPQKAEAEVLLKAALLAELNKQPADQPVMLKLTLPETDGFFDELVAHPSVLRVVALSGGYSRDDANARLGRNKGVIASFSRALTEGLSAQQTEAEFNTAIGASIASIYAASIS
jgi:fructose-bisphosphate aldolase class I